MKRIAIFASGSGSNAENIVNYFESYEDVEVVLIVASKSTAKVLDRAARLGIPSCTLTRRFFKSNSFSDLLQSQQVDLIVLAGFLWLIPTHLIERFPNRIINIHPALLPKYGGKGMYGKYVHEAVHQNQESESGITIHYVNEAYDEGQIIFQAACSIESVDTPDRIAEKIHTLEYAHFPRIIHSVLDSLS